MFIYRFGIERILYSCHYFKRRFHFNYSSNQQMRQTHPKIYENREDQSLKFSQPVRRKTEVDFNPRLYVTSDISLNDVLLIKEAFDQYDTNGSGKLTPNDLKLALIKSYNIIAEYDEQCIGGLNFAAFMRIISSDPRQLQPRSQLQKVFKKYDKQNKGFITRENLQEVIRSQGEKMTQMQMDRLWYKMDKNNRGKVDFDRFMQLMHHPNSIC